MRLKSMLLLGAFVIGNATLVLGQGAPVGAAVKPKKKEQRALEEFKGKLEGKIAWSSSRSNRLHDIWIMNADGTDKTQLTKSNNVDWFSRFSPDGGRVTFARSKMGWVKEMDAKFYDKWDVWMVNVDGSDEKKIVEDACWANWIGDNEISFARGGKVFTKDLGSGEEELLWDAEEAIKKGTIAQQPQLAPNRKFLAATLRGSSRETGIWNFEKKEWYTMGGGCQINWFPSSEEVFRMNEVSYNTSVLRVPIDENGKPTVKMTGRLRIPKKIVMMDLPGRRTHEYFPKLDQEGEWMVWCATAKGHDHDIYDYEVYVWKIGDDIKKGPVRLTFHSGNDRWPDIFLGKASAPAPAPEPAPEPAMEEESRDDDTDAMEEDAPDSEESDMDIDMDM
ncbi:MAG: hypothetical protein GF398_06315 [Chitinivibrionales bacterium]|nr:hypothetical protein [Chitinivibrionales bacterium]